MNIRPSCKPQTRLWTPIQLSEKSRKHSQWGSVLVGLILFAGLPLTAWGELGVDWEVATTDADWGQRIFHASAVHGGRIWVIGGLFDGSVRLNDVWSSHNGADWDLITEDPGWDGRFGHRAVAFQGKLWVIAGGTDQSPYTSEVLCSEDGAEWDPITKVAPWAPREFPGVVAFDDRLWVIGGWDDQKFYGDVWSSTNGLDWIEEVENAPWEARTDHCVVVHDGKIWVMAGFGVSGLFGDVWFSENGVDWTEALVEEPIWSPRLLAGAESLRGRIWVMGGNDGESKNDVWFSPDGIKWTEAAKIANWPARDAHSTAVFEDALFVLGGSSPLNDFSDVWYSLNPLNNPSTPTPIAPLNGALQQPQDTFLEASPFLDADEDAHAHTQWQVDDDDDFSSPEWDSGESFPAGTSVNSPLKIMLRPPYSEIGLVAGQDFEIGPRVGVGKSISCCVHG